MIPVHFKVQELVPPEVYAELGDAALILMDSRILYAIDMLRDIVKAPIIINNWHIGGDRRYCGFRPPDCGVGVKNSQHKYGRAVDCLCGGYSGEDLREIVRDRWRFVDVTYIEPNVSWLHMDCRNAI